MLESLFLFAARMENDINVLIYFSAERRPAVDVVVQVEIAVLSSDLVHTEASSQSGLFLLKLISYGDITLPRRRQ